MAAPELPPPPLRSLLAEKEGMVGPVWARWLQQLWDGLKALTGRVSALEGGGGTPGALLRAMYYQPAAQSIPDSTSTILDFSTADIAHANITTGASWKFTATTAGVYQVSAGGSLIFPFPTTLGTGYLALAKNGVELQRLARLQGVIATNCLTGATLIQLAVGDFIDIRLFQNSGSARTLEGGRQNWFSIHQLPPA